MNIDFSLILNLILGAFSIWEIVSKIKDKEQTKKDKEYYKARLKDWHNQSEGIHYALLDIRNYHEFSDKKDVAQAVSAVAHQANTLARTFAEERFSSDEEVKKEREERARETKKLLENYSKIATPLPISKEEEIDKP